MTYEKKATAAATAAVVVAAATVMVTAATAVPTIKKLTYRKEKNYSKIYFFCITSTLPSI